MNFFQALNFPLFRNTLLCSCFLTSSVFAHTPLNPDKVMEFKISNSGLTRISIENDAIEDVYAYPAEPDLITHHKSGHVFVTPDSLEVPVYLTVITRKGIAQDLRLTPVAKKAEPILLRAAEESASASVQQSAAQTPQDTYASVLKQFLQGKVPHGFTATSVQEVSRGAEPIVVSLSQAYQNGLFRVLVFNLKNETSERHSLDNRGYWGKGDLASAFDRASIGSKETARLFVIQHF